MTGYRGRSIVVIITLTAGFALGLVGWVWDDLEHLGLLQLGLGEAPGHILMALSSLLVLGMLILLLRRAAGRLLAYACFAAGFALALAHPLAQSIVLLLLPLAAAWFYRLDEKRMTWLTVAAAGMAVVLIGGVVDWLWHSAYPDLHETNMLLLPGHLVQLVGWLVGLSGASMALWDARIRHKLSRGQGVPSARYLETL